VIFNNIHNTVVINNTTNTITITDQGGRSRTETPAAPSGPAGREPGPAPAAAVIGPSLPPSVQRKATTIQQPGPAFPGQAPSDLQKQQPGQPLPGAPGQPPPR